MQTTSDEQAVLPPGAPNPRVIAHEFMQLLGELKKDNHPELLGARQELLAAIDEFSSSTNRELGELALWARLRAIESTITSLSIGRIRSLAKQFHVQAKRIGTRTPEGKAIDEVARSMHGLYKALAALKDASNARDENQRAQAHQMLIDAQKKMASVRERYGDF